MNPYLKYAPGGPVDPKKKVNIDGKEMEIGSDEYRKLYDTNSIMPVDSEGLPTMYGPEATITAKAPDWLKVKRGEMTKGMAMSKAAMSELGKEAAEQTGIAGAYKLAKDPVGTLGNAAGFFEDLMMASHSMPKQVMHPGEYKPEHVEGLMNTVDAAGLATAGIAAVKKPVQEGLKQTGKYLTTQTPLKNTYKYNPFAEKLNNKNKSYRVAGYDAADDFLESGVLRSKTPKVSDNADAISKLLGNRPTSFPSFQKGYADLKYLPKDGGVVFETKLPTYKRGEINPVTGKEIKGRHYAHRVIDEKTGEVISEIPKENITMYDGNPHWLKGFKKTFNSEKNIDLPEMTKAGMTWGLNPMSYILGNKMPKDVYYRKIGSRKGMESLVKNKALTSPNSSVDNLSELGGDYTFYSTGNKPDESYRGIYAASYNPEKTLGKNVRGFRHFMGPRGQHKGLTPIDSQGNSMYIPLDDEGVDIWRRLPFSNSYTKVNKDDILNGNYTDLGKGLDFLQDISEKGAKGILYGSLGQMGLNSMFGDNQEDEDPNNPGYHKTRKKERYNDAPDKFKPKPFGEPLYKQIYHANEYLKNQFNDINKKQSGEQQSYRTGGSVNPYLTDPIDPEEEKKELERQIKNRLLGKEDTGITMTKLSPNEEATYQSWIKSLTPNLRESANDKNFDMRGAWKTGEQPELFYFDNDKFMSAHDIDVNQQESIYQPHLFSRNPYSGKYLKGPYHPTQQHAMEGDIRSGYTPYIDVKSGDWFSKQMASGGQVETAPIEIEASERIYDNQGNLMLETPADAPKHEQGGVKLDAPVGSFVFPKKYFNALDSMSTLPEFNKIKKQMLANAEKAYLAGEKYSSGGKPV